MSEVRLPCLEELAAQAEDLGAEIGLPKHLVFAFMVMATPAMPEVHRYEDPATQPWRPL